MSQLKARKCGDCEKLIPFQIAEPFKAYPDIINVRSRWETAEVELAY